jgi:hypothetical protein
MKQWAKAVAVAGASLAAGAASAVAVGRWAWVRSTARTVDRLVQGRSSPHPAVFSPEQLADLPEPVARYFHFALTPGQPLIRSARIEHHGELRLGGFESPWRPFTSTQHVSTDPPGFVWDAALRMVPFLSVRVRDSYLDGIGSMQARLAGLIPVVDQSGGLELAAGSLHRYLAEAPWFPTALLPGHGLTWEPIDGTQARVTLTDQETTVSLEFQFAENGAIERTFTPERYREVAGAYVPTPWAGTYREYAWVEGMRVPIVGEVEWILSGGRLPVWRGRIRCIRYAFGR